VRHLTANDQARGETRKFQGVNNPTLQRPHEGIVHDNQPSSNTGKGRHFGGSSNLCPVEQFSQQGFIQFLAFEPISAGDGRAVIRLNPKPEHLNHNGTINAAVLYGLSEVAGAGAVVADMLELAAESYTVVRRATIEYLAPARGAVDAIGQVEPSAIEQAREQLLRGGAVEVDVPVFVTDAGGTQVTTVRFTVAIRPKRKST
jgi:acyl-CoA thioesterase